MAEIKTPGVSNICTGIPNAGNALAKAYAKYTGIPVINIFGKEQRGSSRRIIAAKNPETNEGKLRIIDDLAIRGQTKLEAIKAAESMGFEIVDIVVLVDRQQGAAYDLEDAGYSLQSAFTIDQVLQFGLQTKRITNEQYQKVKKYLNT